VFREQKGDKWCLQTALPVCGLPVAEGSKCAPDPSALDAEALKEYLQKLNPEDFGKFTP
jgi:hypothetical protein